MREQGAHAMGRPLPRQHYTSTTTSPHSSAETVAGTVATVMADVVANVSEQQDEWITPFASELFYSLRMEIIFFCIFLVSWMLSRFLRNSASKNEHVLETFTTPVAERPQRTLSRQAPLTNSSVSEGRRGSSSHIEVHMPCPSDSGVASQILAACRNGTSSSAIVAVNIYNQVLNHKAYLDLGAEVDKTQFYTLFIPAVIRANCAKDLLLYLHHMQQSGAAFTPLLLSSIVKLCTSKHLFTDVINMYDFVEKTWPESLQVVEKTIWSCFLFCATEARNSHKSQVFFNRIKEIGSPSAKDYGNIIRVLTISQDWRAAHARLQEMKSSGLKIDNVIYNAALSNFVQAQQLELAEQLLDDMEQREGAADVITYNTMMKGYARAGLLTKCTRLHQRMTQQGVQPSEVSFGILLDACINGSAIDTAAKLFDEMVEAGCPINTVLLTTLIKGFTKTSRVEEAMAIYRRMLQIQSAQPDLVTFSILITANCEVGKVDQAMELFDSMIKLGCQPDEIVFNNLLSGCGKVGNIDLAWKLLADMVNCGVKPTNPTFSILLRLLTQYRRFDEAADLLWKADAEYGVQPELRLFIQFAQACIRNRQGQRALEVFPTIVGQATADSQAPTTIIHACVTFNMLETAASMLNLLAEANGKICAREANALLDASLKKRKTATAAVALKAMQQLHIIVEPRLQEQVARLNMASE